MYVIYVCNVCMYVCMYVLDFAHVQRNLAHHEFICKCTFHSNFCNHKAMSSYNALIAPDAITMR